LGVPATSLFVVALSCSFPEMERGGSFEKEAWI